MPCSRGAWSGGVCSCWGDAWSGGSAPRGGLLPGGLLLGGLLPRGLLWGGPPPQMATSAGGMHPTGTSSCLLSFDCFSFLFWEFSPIPVQLNLVILNRFKIRLRIFPENLTVQLTNIMSDLEGQDKALLAPFAALFFPFHTDINHLKAPPKHWTSRSTPRWTSASTGALWIRRDRSPRSLSISIVTSGLTVPKYDRCHGYVTMVKLLHRAVVQVSKRRT